MVWGIIGAMDIEVALLEERMNVKTTEDYFGTTYYKGTLGDQSVVLVRCGIGKINAAICANTLIRDYGVTHLLNVGIAGGLSDSLSVMDVVVSQEVLFHDIDFEIYNAIFPMKTVFQADDFLISLCEKALANQPDISYQVGRIATGDNFIDTSAQKSDIVHRLSPLCVEMEGAAIAHVAYGNQVPFVILRTISDGADDDATDSYDNFATMAAHHAATIVLDMLALASQ